MRISYWSSDVCSSDLLVRFRQRAFFGQRLQRGEAAPAGFHLELAALCLAHDEVLQQAARGDVRPQLEISKIVARLADIARARAELLQGNGLDHGCSPDGMKSNRKSVVEGKGVSVRGDPGGR